MPEAAPPAASVPPPTIRRRTATVMMLLAAGLFAIMLVAALFTLRSVSRETNWVEHTLAAEAQINALATLNERIETARRGYLIVADSSFATVTERSLTQFDQDLGKLERLIADNPRQAARTRVVAKLSKERASRARALLASDEILRSIRAGDFTREPGVLVTRKIRRHLQDMLRAEQALLTYRNSRQLDALVQFYVVGGLALSLLLALLVGAILIISRYNREITVAQARLEEVNEGLEDAVAARTAELSRANAEIQRFAYIVSHDLRSPLVNVLGFTAELDQSRRTLHAFLTKLFEEQPELRDDAAWLAVEEDLPEALGFIRTSTEKMDRLINSILELSRQGRRTLAPEPLDMDALVQTVVATLRQRADAAGATVTVAPIPHLVSDRMAVEQILANLIENALKYLSPARPGEVRIEGRKAGRLIEIEVIDNGRGIAPADHERIFDLFRRAGAQDQAGEGIGLANVRALAYRLGGRVSVASEVDRGARFTLTLPEKFNAAE